MAKNSNLVKEVQDELKRVVDEALKKITKSDLDSVAVVAIDKIKENVSKGISPIAGNGRFPAYKAAAALNSASKISRGLRSALRVGAGKGANDNKIRENLASSVKSERKAKLGYPFSVQSKFPNKRERPVNLFLSGKFLSKLRFKSTVADKSFEIGFYDELSVNKEKGHRAGTNGQGIRPIIPTESESFSQSIVLAIEDALRTILNRISK